MIPKETMFIATPGVIPPRLIVTSFTEAFHLIAKFNSRKYIVSVSRRATSHAKI
jgi:hypothetical protein